MKPTVREIAKQAGVSIASVSLVLNDKPSRITEATRQRIIKAAEELGYVFEKKLPKQAAVACLEDKMIGVILPKHRDPFLDDCLMGIEKYAYVHGFKVLTCYVEDSTEQAVEYIELFDRMAVVGILMIPPGDMNENHNNEKLGAALRTGKRPFLLLDEAIDRVYCDFITADNKGGAYLATEYLIHNGHHQVGMIAGKRDTYTCRKRVEGYKEALAFYDISIREDHLFYGSYTRQTGYEGMKYFDQMGIRAVFAGNEELALGVYRYAREKGLTIGEDISLVGFCDSTVADLLRPPLTAIHQPGEMMGKKTCEVLINRVTGADKEPFRNNYFGPWLTERSSVKQVYLEE